MSKFLDQAGLTALWNKIKSTFYTKTELSDIVAHEYSSNGTMPSEGYGSDFEAVLDAILGNSTMPISLRQLYLDSDARAAGDINKMSYNDTGADIVKTDQWGNSITHKAGHYWLNGLGDITESEMAQIYAFSRITAAAKSVSTFIQGNSTRTVIPSVKLIWNERINCSQIFGYCSNMVAVCVGPNNPQYLGGSPAWMTVGCSKLKYIVGIIDVSALSSSANMFSAPLLEEFRFKNLKINMSISSCPNISYNTLNYLIANTANTSAITITVNATTYSYLMGTGTPTEQVGGTSAQWQQIVTDATAKNISFATP